MPILNHYLKALKKGFTVLLFVQIISNTLDYWFTSQIEGIQMNPSANQTLLLIAFGGGALVINLLLPMILGFYSYFVLAKVVQTTEASFAYFAGKKWENYIIENMRSWGKILLHTLFFVLPGIWQWIKLSLVPLITLFLEEYEQGKVDALKYSGQLLKGAYGRILVLLVVFSMIWPLLMTGLFDEYKIYWSTPIAAILLTAAEVSVGLFFNLLMFRLFQKRLSLLKTANLQVVNS